MSVKASSWAWEQATESSGQRLVLLALADAAGGNDNDARMCWPSVARIARMCRLDGGNVRRHIDRLAELGLITKHQRQRRADGTLGTWTYLVEFTSAHPRAVDGSTSARPGAEPARVGARTDPSEDPSSTSTPYAIDSRAWCDETCELCEGVGWIYPNGDPSGVDAVAPCPNRSK